MNSEELELSLRTEFESHLKNVAAEMRQEFSQLQEKVEAEFSKHKSQLDAVFQEFSARFETEKTLDAGFTGTVVEHLRLARDEGARITATAFTQAEEMEKQSIADAPPIAGISELSSAVSDIMAQDSQATILQSLVQHAAQFTPRGAFFIIKNEQFVGWRVFGTEADTDDASVREVLFPVASPTVLGESVRSLSAVESSFGTYADDSVYLNQLQFGQPDRMYAVPLIARGRGVAVLYADYGTKSEAVNLEALETLVRVAGLTVEVLAAAPAVRPVQEVQAVSDDYQEPAAAESEDDYAESEAETSSEFQSATDEQDELTESAADTAETESEEYAAQPVVISDYEAVQPAEESAEVAVREEDIVEEEESEIYHPVVVEENADSSTYQPLGADDDDEKFISDQTADSRHAASSVEAEESEEVETPSYAAPSFEPVESLPAQESYSNGRAQISDTEVFEPVASEPVTTAPVKSRFSDRNVDLPIEVGENERRLHNDARRFARLLVSEIKLYNEQKVKEGREAQDLYDRLREAIDRSRDMYDKRVQPPVAAKFDYFHYELVSSLAEGEEGKLGGGYPGAAI